MFYAWMLTSQHRTPEEVQALSPPARAFCKAVWRLEMERDAAK